VPALEVFDAVSRGSAEMGHGAAYYWKGKSPAAPFFTSVPFGLTAQEMNGWLYHGGGLELWRELYDGFNLVPFEAGNTGTQMGGWFNKEINTLDDLKGLKMRIPGLGGDVMQRLGVTTVNIPGGELFTSLQSGAIDATEWVGPYNDLAFGLYKAAKYYYYPGWQEPGPTLECIVNKDAWKKLPEDLQAIVATACQATGSQMLAEYAARNQAALDTLVQKHGVKLRPFPDEVLAALKETSQQVLEDLVAEDAFSRKVYESFSQYRDQVRNASSLAEQAYLNARD
ncbi:MAG: TRAP transporter substrate-binding protein DctP, partial [Salinisphaeraceae bacterium]|nr:TRAP transporter substrate-binding protein DctP [Salinisphaeraceae bacterium]